MKKILTVDIGNSHQEYALFNENETFVAKGDFQNIVEVIEKEKPSCTIVSSVDDNFLHNIPTNYTLVRKYFSKNTFIDMPITYTQTIGDDRLASIYYLYKLNQQDKVLVDSGTYTTLDFISSKGHLGGYIIPGEQILKLSFVHGKQLKEVKLPEQITLTKELPQNTSEAMAQGSQAGFLFPIKGLIKQNRVENIYLTGGNCEKVAEFLKSSKDDFKLMLSKELLHRSLCYIAKRKCL